jgi:hypothetical protein
MEGQELLGGPFPGKVAATLAEVDNQREIAQQGTFWLGPAGLVLASQLERCSWVPLKRTIQRAARAVFHAHA